MKNLITLGFATALALAACDKKPIAEAPPPTIPAATPPTVVPSTPPPATPEPVAVTTPAPNYFAPDGVYFLLEPTSVETPEGVSGLKPGTRLQRIGSGKYSTSGHEIALRDDQVTNDLRIAQRIAGADAAAQAALRRAMAADTTAPAPLPPGAHVYTTTTTTIGPDGKPVTRQVTSTSISTRTEPAPTPQIRYVPNPATPSGLNKGAYGEKKAFNRPFDVR